ncbi:MAG: diaminopimelate epimerase [Clostridia bacterium]
MSIPFRKMNGCGNDFIVIDNRTGIMNEIDLPSFVRRVCQRRVSLGADGVMLVEPSATADFTMRYFNADGSEGEMCGNGARCISRFAYLIGAAPASMCFQTLDGLYAAQIEDEGVSVRFPPLDLDTVKLHQTSSFDGQTVTYHFTHVGVPHAVVFVEHADQMSVADVIQLGRAMRHDTSVFPHGSNVNFVEVLDPDTLRVRTYERGVEDETLACGSGSTASAIVSYLLGKVSSSVRVQVNGGMLHIRFSQRGECMDDITLAGEARTIAVGELLEEAWR